jgi:hypothetical protein
MDSIAAAQPQAGLVTEKVQNQSDQTYRHCNDEGNNKSHSQR